MDFFAQVKNSMKKTGGDNSSAGSAALGKRERAESI
jgi:hypothetical protein